jgi:hypothetical protein
MVVEEVAAIEVPAMTGYTSSVIRGPELAASLVNPPKAAGLWSMGCSYR